MSVAMRHGIVSTVSGVAVCAGDARRWCERASDCKPPMSWSERGWAPTRAKLEWPGPTCRALTCRTGHCSFVTDGDSTTSALHAISADLVDRRSGLINAGAVPDLDAETDAGAVVVEDAIFRRCNYGWNQNTFRRCLSFMKIRCRGMRDLADVDLRKINCHPASFSLLFL